MARWIALDWGARRTGLAVSDALGMIATPLDTVDTVELMGGLARLVAEEPCAGIVLGEPAPGSDSSAGVAAAREAIHRAFPALPIHCIDEGSTSWEARQALVAGGMPKHKREQKGATDRVAAALILQRFLDGERSGGLPPMRRRR
jgi:putative Holliday junction resolvase